MYSLSLAASESTYSSTEHLLECFFLLLFKVSWFALLVNARKTLQILPDNSVGVSHGLTASPHILMGSLAMSLLKDTFLLVLLSRCQVSLGSWTCLCDRIPYSQGCYFKRPWWYQVPGIWSSASEVPFCFACGPRVGYAQNLLPAQLCA